MRRVLLVALMLAVASCASRRPAPVVDRQPVEAPPAPAAEPPKPEPPAEKPLPTHVVKRGETLVGIALQYGLDYRELAAWNNITNPNVLSVGQVLVVAAPPGARPAVPVAPVATPLALGGPIEARPLGNSATLKVEPRGVKVPYSDRALAQLSSPEGVPPGSAPPETTPITPVPAAPSAPGAPEPAPAPVRPAPPPEAEKPGGTEREDVDWIWPAKGRILAPFTENTKGVDIAGRKGAPVVAAAAGRVVYAGAGLRGYGKLVIIKHNNTWLSAYAHNDNLLVKEQQDVRRGQKIAEMGSTDSEQVKLHFEVRRQGKPVDPAKLLPPR
ncbi:MAG TPA: peptidoglycan DD-metalloendopeptidase family protein [Usitatibacter sp.]|nr:peptidoglycan DD-metalloendopeptidase family protein [Usitatibacter sp.]